MKRPHLRLVGVHKFSPACGCYRCVPVPCDGEHFSNLFPERTPEEFMRDARESLERSRELLRGLYK